MDSKYTQELATLMVDNNLSVLNRIRKGTNYYLEIYYQGKLHKMILDLGYVRLGEFEIKSSDNEYPSIDDVSGLVNLFIRDLNFSSYGIN